MPRRLPLVVAVPALLAVGCSSTSGDSPTTPVTAVTFATASSTTVPASVASVPPSSRARATAATTSSIPAPVTSGATTTVTPATTGGASSTSVAAATTAPTAAFTPVPGPDVPDVTHPVEAAWVDPASQELLSVDDGAYWATVAGVGTADGGERFVTFRLAQAFFGDACTAQFGADSCDNDIGTLESPTGTLPMFLGAGRITVADPTTQQSYEISGDVLFELIADPTAAVGAPDGYLYAPFASLLRVTGGQVVSAEQVWTP